MDKIKLKKIFADIAKENRFERAFEGWFKESSEVILVLELQKSNFGNYYYLNIKLYVQGAFGNIYTKNKKLVKSNTGDIFIRPPDIYSKLLDLDISIDDEIRKEGIKKMFTDFIVPFANKTTTKQEIINLHRQGGLFILPAVMKQLGISSDSQPSIE